MLRNIKMTFTTKVENVIVRNIIYQVYPPSIINNCSIYTSKTGL